MFNIKVNLALMIYFEFTLLTILLIDRFNVLKTEINLVQKFFSRISKTAVMKKKTKVKPLKNGQNLSKISYKQEGSYKTYRISKMLLIFLTNYFS